jgi:YVTN family beta-propeller protein
MVKWATAALAMVGLIGSGAADGTAAAPKAYVGLFRDDAVAVVDTASNRVVRTIPVPKGPHGLVITPDGRKVYVSSDGASTVSVIDTATDRVVATIDVGPNPHGLALARDGKLVLVSAWGANQAVFIETAGDTIVGRVPVAQAHNGALSADGRVAFVGSQLQGATALVRIDVAAMRESGRVPLDRTPRALDLTPDGQRLYFTVAGLAAVLVLDTATNAVVKEIPVGASPHQAPLTPDGRLALVPSQGPGELGLIDTGTNAVAATVAVGKTPHWVVASSDGQLAYVTNEGSNDVSVVDLGRRAVVATIPVGNGPRKVAVQAGTVPRAAAAELTLRADDYVFSPASLRGQPGQRVRVRVENASSTLHNLTIPALGLDRDLPPHGRVEVDLEFPAAGVVPFHCKFHGPLGQTGQLVVERN